MKALTRITIALFISLTLAESSFSQSIYEHGCTCDASTKLENYVKSSSKEVERIATALFRNSGSKKWSVARTNVQKISGLKANGHPDPRDPLDAYFVTYATDSPSIRRSTLWAHQYGLETWRPVDYGRFEELASRGFSTYEDFRSKTGKKEFLLVAHSGGRVPPADVASTNVIFIDHAHLPQNYESFKKINEQFADSFPSAARKDLYFARVLFITSCKQNGEQVITIYERPFYNMLPWSSDRQYHLIGNAYTLGVGNQRAYEALSTRLKHLGQGGRVFLYGEDTEGIEELADQYQVELIRRGPNTVKNFAVTESHLNSIENRGFKKETTVLLNGTPSTTEELRLISPLSPLYGLNDWVADKERVESITRGRYHRRIENKEQLLHELREGDSDAILIVGHSDGRNIYFGRDRVSIEELNALPPRQGLRLRPRLAVLISCGTGASGRRLWKETRPIAEVLVDKSFVDAVIAPDHEISAEEGIRALKDILRGRPLSAIRSHKGWRKFAGIKVYVGGGKV